MSDGDDLLAKIDEAIEGWEQHKVHVPDALMPDLPTAPIETHVEKLFPEEELFPITFTFQRQMIDAMMRGERLDLATFHRRSSAVPGRRPDEEMLEKMNLVRGPSVDMVILDEAMDFTEAPLFGRQDAGLDELEPDGPIDVEGDDVPGWFTEAREDFDRELQRISSFTGMPRRRTLPEQLCRSLLACGASVLSRIPGIRS